MNSDNPLFYSSSLSLPVLVLCPTLEEDEQTVLFVTRQTAHTAFKVLLGNMFHMLGKTPSSSVNHFAMFEYNIHLKDGHLSLHYDALSVLLLSHIRML